MDWSETGKNPYEILGLENGQEATEAEIRKVSYNDTFFIYYNRLIKSRILSCFKCSWLVPTSMLDTMR